MTMPTGPRTIIAVTTEDERHLSVIDRAASLASQTAGTVILFDLDADMGPLESPLPTAWSGDEEDAHPGDRLAPTDLEAAGRSALADQVRAIRAAGVEAFGWLPPRADASSLAEYAANQAADLVLVSTEDTELIDALRSAEPAPGGTVDDTQSREMAKRIQIEAVSPS
jgi:hypothetical protein